MSDTFCLYSQIKNTSGGTLFFGFIPPHGITMKSNDCVFVFGDVWDRIRSGWRLNERARTSFENALTNGLIEIINSPAQFIFDRGNNTVKQLKISSGVVSTQDPCYGAFSGSGCS